MDRIVDEVLEQHEILGPPVNALQLAVRMGFRIAWNEGQGGRARLVRSPQANVDAPGTILLTPEPRLERRQWAVAHELGESLAWRVFDAIDQDPRDAQPNLRELIANRLAGRLLVPDQWFLAAGDEWDGICCD
ncbi:MAG: ImmA/IrrE family metallo-endopeptidase [Pirellulales bacterium]